MQQTNLKSKELGAKKNQVEVKQRDLGKILVTGRKICYCQTTMHALVNNCASCGKIVCEQEGEGPCLFCGAWVDREDAQELDDEL